MAPRSSGAAQMEIEKSRDEATKEPLPQLAEALLGRQRAHSFLKIVRVCVFKQAGCLRREEAGQRFSEGLLCRLAQVCGTEGRAADVPVDRALHLCNKVEDTALVGKGDPMLVEFSLPIRVARGQS